MTDPVMIIDCGATVSIVGTPAQIVTKMRSLGVDPFDQGERVYLERRAREYPRDRCVVMTRREEILVK